MLAVPQSDGRRKGLIKPPVVARKGVFTSKVANCQRGVGITQVGPVTLHNERNTECPHVGPRCSVDFIGRHVRVVDQKGSSHSHHVTGDDVVAWGRLANI